MVSKCAFLSSLSSASQKNDPPSLFLRRKGYGGQVELRMGRLESPTPDATRRCGTSRNVRLLLVFNKHSTTYMSSVHCCTFGLAFNITPRSAHNSAAPHVAHRDTCIPDCLRHIGHPALAAPYPALSHRERVHFFTSAALLILLARPRSPIPGCRHRVPG